MTGTPVLYGLLLPARRLISYRRDRRERTQLCKRCGRAQSEIGFCVSDREWQAVVPARWRRWALCLTCFERFAAEQGRPVVKVFLVDGA
jgi:hypothetical protein